MVRSDSCLPNDSYRGLGNGVGCILHRTQGDERPSNGETAGAILSSTRGKQPHIGISPFSVASEAEPNIAYPMDQLLYKVLDMPASESRKGSKQGMVHANGRLCDRNPDPGKKPVANKSPPERIPGKAPLAKWFPLWSRHLTPPKNMP